MQIRPATAADVAQLAVLQARSDVAHFGAVENDEDEVREGFDRVVSPGTDTRLVLDDGHVVAAAWFTHGDSTLLVDPDADAAPLYAELLPWLAAHHNDLPVLEGDEPLNAALADRDWTYHHSSFELIRAVSDDWTPAEPVWPAGVRIGPLGPDDARDIHHLIYVDAAWAEIPGHPERDYEQWRSIFLTDQEVPEQQLLARRDGVLVGVAMGRIFSDGTGWIGQLAVAKSERGRGLGRALLLAALHRRVADGASALGLAVEAANRTAIALYLDVGLRVDREWQLYRPPPAV